MHPHESIRENRKVWQGFAQHGHRLATPATAEELADPLNKVDSMGWLGGDIRGWHVLCLAAGGGRHGPLYAAAGAHVTVVDFSAAMLDLDRKVAADTGLNFQTVETTMDELGMFSDGQFDLVIHPVSTCYVSDVPKVYREVARVTRAGGLYVSQHKQPTSLQASQHGAASGYVIEYAYSRSEPLPPARENNLVRELGAREYIHRWETLLGQLCLSGFVIEDLREPNHADPAAAANSFGHRSHYLPPYVRIKARRTPSGVSVSRTLIVEA